MEELGQEEVKMNFDFIFLVLEGKKEKDINRFSF